MVHLLTVVLAFILCTYHPIVVSAATEQDDHLQPTKRECYEFQKSSKADTVELHINFQNIPATTMRRKLTSTADLKTVKL